MRSSQKPTQPSSAFDLKGCTQTLMVLYLWEPDSETLTGQLQEKFGQAPGFFKNLPLIIDLGALQDCGPLTNFGQLLTSLRGYGLVPMAVRGANAVQKEQALAANLGLLSATRSELATAAAEEDVEDPGRPSEYRPEARSNPPPSAKVITQPVRSGQRVVAPNGDLIVLAPVNAGAEILAAGNIHVYGPLRGRALAGVKGDTEARIVCLQFHPELVAIAGEYMVNDEMDQTQFGHSAVVALSDNQLKVDPIGTFIPLP